MIGILIGNLIFGRLADAYGRRRPLLCAVALQAASGCASAAAPEYWSFIVFRLLSTIATGGTMVISFVMVVEAVGGKARTTAGLLYQLPFNLGHLTLVGLAYWLRDWRYLQLGLSLPSVLLLGALTMALTESPRWLLASGRLEECQIVLERIASRNGQCVEKIRHEIAAYAIKEAKESNIINNNIDKKDSGWLDMIRTRIMFIRTLSITFCWWTCGLCFFGIAQFMGQIPGDVFVNVAVSALVGIPGMLLLLVSLRSVGRRTTLLYANVITTIASSLTAAAPSSWSWAPAALGWLGLFGMSLAFPTVYMYSGEMYPTRARNTAVGVCSVSSRIGSMVAPFVIGFGLHHFYVPPIVFAMAPAISAALCFLLPETKNAKLPDSLEEAERIGR